MDQEKPEENGSKLKASKRWRWLGIEFVVIALGVLSALLVDTWVEERNNAAKAAEYRERLIMDLERDVANLDAVVEYYHQIRNYGLATLGDLTGDQRLDEFSLMFAAFNAAEEWGFILESSTFNDMQSTGGLALIDDIQLRIDLADYHRQALSRSQVWMLPRAYRESVRGIIPNALQAAIHESCTADPDSLEPRSAILSPDANFSAAVEPLTGSAASAGQCGLEPTDFDTARAAEELRSDPLIPRLLRFRNSELRVAIALFKGQRVMAERLLEHLEAGGGEP